ncbi:MAG: AAA family ATPase [Chloroflexi bacterium]|nr:AAA family ATPase [Chloroflexota bacterium]
MQSLTAAQLRRTAVADTFTFNTTAELPISTEIIGQPRGTRAIEFGIGIQSQGYNIFVLGESGTGRATAIERFLQDRTKTEPTPGDWVYVHNFELPHKPRAITLPPGEANHFKNRMAKLIHDLRRDLPSAFSTSTYRETIANEQQALTEQQNSLLSTLSAKAEQQGFALAQTPSGYAVIPIQDGEKMTPEAVQALSPERKAEMEKAHIALSEELSDLFSQMHVLESEVMQRMKAVDKEVVEAAVSHYFAELNEAYKKQAELLLYLEQVYQDVLTQIDDFVPPVDNENTDAIDLRRYEVNVLVDNSNTEGTPVVLETDPSYLNLFGRLEYEMQAGYMTTHFTNIKCGSLHHANGGYLIINAHDLMKNPLAWEALKRALDNKLIAVNPLAQVEKTQAIAKSPEPEPIRMNVKIVLMGNPGLYYALHEQDLEFADLFKVRVDFDSTMPRTPENELAYGLFVASRCHEEQLRHFDKTAVSKIVEHGSRLAEHQQKLSTRFGAISDSIREASYWAGVNGRDIATADDVQCALQERIDRANRAEVQIFERILDGTIFIATDGEIIGQVNGLSVLDTGEYAFGQPGRITARTFMGDDGVVHIERETDMSGPLHHKGVLTLSGFLGGTYAQKHPLSLTASLTFEQNYGGIDGDSASSTELYVLLSSLGRIPLKQGIAVTGSVNQRGEVQPIGGVNEKIEGFFRLCKARGLTGTQGVLIPASNVNNLMLREDVVTAVANNQFHIWPVRSINEGIEILTGIPAGERLADGTYPEGTVHHAAQTRLRWLAEELNRFSEGIEPDDED